MTLYMLDKMTSFILLQLCMYRMQGGVRSAIEKASEQTKERKKHRNIDFKFMARSVQFVLVFLLLAKC